MKQVEAQPLGAVSHLWAESPRWLPSKAPWDCSPSAEQQSLFLFCFVLFLQLQKKILTVFPAAPGT